MGEKVAGERGEEVEGRGMQEEKEEEEARYDFSRREMDKDSWIEAWSNEKIGFQPRYFATSAAVIIIGLTEKG